VVQRFSAITRSLLMMQALGDIWRERRALSGFGHGRDGGYEIVPITTSCALTV